MFNLGFGELILLAVIALIVIGPKQLPEVAVTVGRFLNELKRAASDFTDTFVQARDTAFSETRPTPPPAAESQPSPSNENDMKKTVLNEPVSSDEPAKGSGDHA